MKAERICGQNTYQVGGDSDEDEKDEMTIVLFCDIDVAILSVRSSVCLSMTFRD